MAKLDIVNSAEINANANVVWEILGPKFLQISEWACTIKSSTNNESVTKSFEDAPAGGRFCDVKGFGVIDERIIHYSSSKREITWSAASDKIPGFVSGLKNAFSINVIDDNNCRITSNITAEASGIQGFLLGGVMKKSFNKTLAGFFKDLKIYAETGAISEGKQKELAKV